MRTRHVFRAIVPLAVGAVALAGCGGSSSGGGGGGGGSSSAGGGGGSFTLGYQGALSGGNAALGINERNGVKLAVDQANAKHELPYTLGYETADDGGAAAGAPAAARKLIGDSKVIAVVGPIFSGPTNATGDLYKAANLLAVSPSATLPDLTQHGFSTFYRAVADDNAQGPPDADYLIKKLGKKKIFLIDDTTDYGKGLAKAFKAQVSKDGASIAGSDSAPQTSNCIPGATGSASQYPSEASKVKSSGADAVFYAGYYCDFGLLAKALRSAGYKGQLMSGDGSKDTRYITGAGTANAAGTLISCQCSEILANPKGTQFVKDYKAAFGVDPGAYAAEAFDVANSIIGVLKTLGNNPTRAKVAQAYSSVNYDGLTKPITFAPDHNLKVQKAFLYQVTGTTLKYLGDLSKLV